MDYCDGAVLIAERLRDDYRRILNNTCAAPVVAAAAVTAPPAAEGVEDAASLSGIHFVCGDVLDAPFEPEQFGLVVDKGALDCVGMRVPPETFDSKVFGELQTKPKLDFSALEAPEEDDEEIPLDAWSDSMHRLTALRGHLLVVSCCFEPEEVSAALDSSESMFAAEVGFELQESSHQTEEGSTGVWFCLYRKMPRKKEEPA